MFTIKAINAQGSLTKLKFPASFITHRRRPRTEKKRSELKPLENQCYIAQLRCQNSKCSYTLKQSTVRHIISSDADGPAVLTAFSINSSAAVFIVSATSLLTEWTAVKCTEPL